jgi:alpha-1,6-mannosyltransferase
VDGTPLVPRHGGHPGGDHVWGRVFLACLAAAFVLYLAGLAVLRRGGRVGVVLALAAAIQLAPLGAPLLLSTDAWTYWSYARLADPYRDTPSEDAVSREYVGTAWRDKTSVYGPAFSLASEPVGLTRSSGVAAWAFKSAAALAMVVAAWLAARIARRAAFAAAFVGWNPLLAVHSGGGGHNDALMAALVLAALALAARPRWPGAAWALAGLVKWVAFLFLPLRALEARATRRRVGHLSLAVTVAAVSALATAVYGLDWVHFLGPLARNANRETSYALPHRLGVPGWTGVAVFGLAYAWLLYEAWRGRARLALCAALLLVTAPYLAAWYTAWAVPLAAVEEDRTARVLTLALCAYLLPQTIPT